MLSLRAEPAETRHGSASSLPRQWVGLWRLNVRNEGKQSVRQTVLIATLPAGIEFTRASGNGIYDSRTRCLRWELGEFRPGEERAVAFNATAKGGGQQTGTMRLESERRLFQELKWVTNVSSASPTFSSRKE